MNKDKSKTMRNNCQTADPVKLGEQYIKEVTGFTYRTSGPKLQKNGNTEVKIQTRINKARGAFAALKNIWETKKISKKTKIGLRVLKSNMYRAYCYNAAESSEMTKLIYHMLKTVQSKCL